MRYALLAIALAAAPAGAAEVELGVTHERLNRDLPDWKSVYVEAAHALAPGQTVYGQLRQTERFDLRDTELAAGYYHPLGPWTALVDASYSPDHHVLPQWSLLGQLSWRAGAGWVASGGWRHNEYSASGARVAIAGLERYFGPYRAAYTLYNGKPEGAGSGSAHRVALDYYYGERSRIGAAATFGREVENVGEPTGIITSEVRAFALLGRHWLTAAWALTWELGTHEQGELYRRTGARLGLRHGF
jgi:YaiO family outer membrane protein